MSKPAVVKGTRDFLPTEMARRNYIFDTIRNVFRKYGFQPIETPAMELADTLLGKYGEEGDRLIFKILLRGEKFNKLIRSFSNNKQLGLIEGDDVTISKPPIENLREGLFYEEALRYDLTVPFARFVVQHQNDITFPFKRYQIQPVWRADRPQKGRYREFYQCDCDVVGSDSLLYEIELVHIFDEVLSALKIPSFTIRLNNRKVLSGIAEVCGQPDKIVDITVAIDKLDKVGEGGVVKELQDRGLADTSIEKIKPLLSLSGSEEDKLNQMKAMLIDSQVGLKGIEELEFVLEGVQISGLQQAELELDFSLARGLNYYTGAIFEVRANGVQIGSICGGGRYSDLTSLFGKPDLPGVGISFGADRIYDVLNELNLFPELTTDSTQVLIVQFDEKLLPAYIKLAAKLRTEGLNTEVYPDPAKPKKQFKYANDKGIPFVLIQGEDEVSKGVWQVKDMRSGEQEELTEGAAVERIKAGL